MNLEREHNIENDPSGFETHDTGFGREKERRKGTVRWNGGRVDAFNSHGYHRRVKRYTNFLFMPTLLSLSLFLYIYLCTCMYVNYYYRMMLNKN